VGVELAEELRELVATGDARGAPEVDDDRPAAQRREVERDAVERRAGYRRCGLVDGGTSIGRAVTRAPGDVDERPDADGREDSDRESDKDRTTRRGV
jgi:hypothetical protein